MAPASTGYTSPGSMLAISSVLPALDIIIVALRFYTRRYQNAPLQLDDWMLIPALVFTVAMGVDLIVGVKGHGIGYRTPPPNVPGPEGPLLSISPEVTLADTVEWISLWLQPLALGCIKISILAFYRRVFDARKKGFFHVMIQLFIGFLVVWIIAFFFVEFFMCGTAFSNLWGPYITLHTKCSNGHALWIDEAFSISDFILDILVFFVPLPNIWSLQMTLKRRLLVSLIFVVGALAIVGSGIRMAIFIQVLDGIYSSIDSQDGLISIAQFLFWSMLEAGLAVIVTCLPTLNFLFGKLNATSMLSSIRSILSLDSLRSGRTGDSGESRHRDDTRTVADNASASSQLKMIPSMTGDNEQHPFGVETHVMSDLEDQRDPPAGQIMVHSDVQHSNLNKH